MWDFQSCTKVRRPPELATLPDRAYPASPLISHSEEHGVLVALLQGMYEQEIKAALRYGTHASSLKEAEFIHVKLADQVQALDVAVLPLE